MCTKLKTESTAINSHDNKNSQRLCKLTVKIRMVQPKRLKYHNKGQFKRQLTNFGLTQAPRKEKEDKKREEREIERTTEKGDEKHR